MKRFPSVYTLLINTIYLSHSTQVTRGTVFRKQPVPERRLVFRLSQPFLKPSAEDIDQPDNNNVVNNNNNNNNVVGFYIIFERETCGQTKFRIFHKTRYILLNILKNIYKFSLLFKYQCIFYNSVHC